MTAMDRTDWTTLGCGWQVWNYPVVLEPVYRPYVRQKQRAAFVDDGVKESVGSRVGNWIRRPFRKKVREDSAPYILPEYKPEIQVTSGKPHELICAIPIKTRVRREAALELLLTLPREEHPVSFEIVADSEEIRVQFATHGDQHLLKRHIRGYFPDCVITEPEQKLSDLWNSQSGDHLVLELGLSESFIQPTRVASGFDVDPLIALFSSLGNVTEGEVAVVQVLFVPSKSPWKEAGLEIIQRSSTGSDSSDVQKAAIKKLTQPLFSVILRLGVKAATEIKVKHIARSLLGALKHFDSTTGNSYIPLSNEGYTEESHEHDFLNRSSHRSGMLLSGDELVSLVHLPSSSVVSSKLLRSTLRTKRAPDTVFGNPLILGTNSHDGKKNIVSLSDEQRTRHLHIVGASGTGKSHLLHTSQIQDALHGGGFAVLDPHGDLVDQLLPYIPENRVDDVILFDPADEEYPIGFNILQAHSSLEKQLLSSDLVAIFKRLSTSWGDQMNSVLGNAILAFLESDNGGTLSDMRRFLVEKDFRMKFLENVQDDEVRYYWQQEFPLLSGRPQAPLLTRLDSFLRPKLIRHIVSQKENNLDFGHIMNSGKILLAKLSQGAIGEENSYLLGSLLVSKFYQLALSRQEIQEGLRRPFYLYIDEFHHFITPTLSTILSGARKYRLGLVLAHQDMRQLQSKDAELTSAVLTNPFTRICFRVGDMDVRLLESGFSSFEGPDLLNLGRGQAIARVERNDYDFNLETHALPELKESFVEQVIEQSREKYGTPLHEVEEALSLEKTSKAPELPKEPATPTQKEIIRLPKPPPEPIEIPTPKKKPTLGKGGQQHKYLQELIKRWGEHNGFRSIIEKPILDGLGSIDVALETDDISVACEISVTSTPQYEWGNVQKCLAAGFHHVIVVSADEKTLQRTEEHIVPKLDDKDTERVRFCSPEALFEFLGSLPNSQTEKVVGGYKVEVRFKEGSEEEEKARKNALSRVIMDSIRRIQPSKK